MDAIKSVYSKYATFTGRATRSEYWLFVLFFLVVYLALVLGGQALDLGILVILGIVFLLASLLPMIAVSVRRLHDTGRSGWFYLLNFIPIANIVLLVFMCFESAPDNEYGPNPHGNGGIAGGQLPGINQ